MRITIYDGSTMIGSAMAAAFNIEKLFGPTIFHYTWQPDLAGRFQNKDILVWHNRPKSDQIGHLETLRHMEVDTLNSQSEITFLDGYFEKFEEEFEHVVWANYFGNVNHKHYKFVHHDKLIICDQSAPMQAFHYQLNTQSKVITTEKQIRDHTEHWRTDHVELNGEHTSDWINIWNDNFHDQAVKDMNDGKLKYFWQLNRLHWAVFKEDNWQDAKDKMPSVQDMEADVERCYLNFSTKRQDYILENNPDAFIADRLWYSDQEIEKLEEFLNYSFTVEQLKNIKMYGEKQDANWQEFCQKYPKLSKNGDENSYVGLSY